MSSISLIDIINIELSLGDKILCDNNKAQSAICINNTCKIFNKITKEEIIKHQEEYYKCFLPKQIEKTIKDKMFSILKNPKNANTYKEPNEYEADLEKLSKKINENNYDIILAKIITDYKEYVYQYYIYDNDGGTSYMFGILMNEYYNFIKNHMKYELKREDFDENDIYSMIYLEDIL
jgi:hypothetical protein